jgi:uncharacterized protein (TIGR03382 family)
MRATVAACVGILLGTLLSPTCAQTTISTPQFELTASDREALTRLDLVSHTESESRFQLSDMNRTSRITSQPHPDVFYDVLQRYALDIEVQAGYQITGFTMGLEASAAAVHDPRAESKGAAEIAPYQMFFIAATGSVLGQASATSLRPDAQALLAETRDISLTGQFELDIYTDWWVHLSEGSTVTGDREHYFYYPTYLDVSQSGAYFIIHTAAVNAVPEPASAAMCLAGLALLVAMRRRRVRATL